MDVSGRHALTHWSSFPFQTERGFLVFDVPGGCSSAPRSSFPFPGFRNGVRMIRQGQRAIWQSRRPHWKHVLSGNGKRETGTGS